MKVLLVAFYMLCVSLTAASPIAEDPSSVEGIDTFGRHGSKPLFDLE